MSPSNGPRLSTIPGLETATDAERMLTNIAAAFADASGFFGGRRRSIAPIAPAHPDDRRPHEPLYRILVEQLPAIVYMAYLDRAISEAYISPQLEESLGFTREEWLDDPLRWYQTIHPDDRGRWSDEAAAFVATGEPLKSAYRVIARDGRVHWFQCDARVVRSAEGLPWFIHGVAFDVTDEKQAEERFRALVESAPDAMILAREDGRIALVNSQAERVFQYARDELLGHPVEMLLPGHARLVCAPGPTRGENIALIGRRKGGEEFPAEVSLAPLETDEEMLISAAIRDVTERTRAEQRVRDALREKDMLLHEVHHRVKNNLAIIASLFYLQSSYAGDERTRRVLEEGQDRVRAMALVHELLYSTHVFSKVSFVDYTVALAQQLMHAYAPAGQIELETRLAPLELDLAQAVPCGLALSEMVTNALKHGFLREQAGRIVVAIERGDDGACEVVVIDDGVGVPPTFDIESTASLGIRLVRMLARQLDGTFRLVSRPGCTEARLAFRAHPS